MKKKYVAVILGLVLSMSTSSVYAAGESDYTITVNSYSDKADLSGASFTTQWSDYEIEKPEELA